jgi:hypothetical protein
MNASARTPGGASQTEHVLRSQPRLFSAVRACLSSRPNGACGDSNLAARNAAADTYSTCLK